MRILKFYSIVLLFINFLVVPPSSAEEDEFCQSTYDKYINMTDSEINGISKKVPKDEKQFYKVALKDRKALSLIQPASFYSSYDEFSDSYKYQSQIQCVKFEKMRYCKNGKLLLTREKFGHALTSEACEWAAFSKIELKCNSNKECESIGIEIHYDSYRTPSGRVAIKGLGEVVSDAITTGGKHIVFFRLGIDEIVKLYDAKENPQLRIYSDIEQMTPQDTILPYEQIKVFVEGLKNEGVEWQ